MDFWFLIIGAIISFAGMVLHGFAGGKIYIGNINKSDLMPLTKSLSLVSWHVFTIFLFVSATTLAYVAFKPSFAIAAYPIIGVNLLGALLFIVLGLGNHRALIKMPGAYLMASTALFAWLGIS